MHRSPKWSPLAALAATLALVFAACGGTTTSASPSAEAPASEAPSAEATEAAPYEGLVYPESGESACGTDGYTGQMGSIKAIDASTVEFTLCASDAAFLAKIAFSVFGIQDADYLETHAADGSYLDTPNGTGPYRLTEWSKGNRMVFEAFADYWGDAPKTPNLELRWSDEAAQRLLELQSGNVDGIDNPGPSDIETILGDSSLQFAARPGLNTMYLGMNNNLAPWDDVKVRHAIAMGIDRQRLVDNFYPEGSTVADYFTPCEIDLGCEGDPWYDFDLAAAKTLLADAGFPAFNTTIYFRDVVRSYLPDPSLVAVELQAQLADLGITAAIEPQESGAFLENSAAGTLNGIYLLGWGADYPDPTNFLDVHFNNPANLQFGTIDSSITDPLSTGAQTLDTDVRRAAYEEANNAIREFVPMIPIAHGASGTAWKADVVGAHSSPLGNEEFGVMDPGGRSQLVWMQNAYPLSLYCADETDGETLRLCEQMTEPLYRYEVAGTAAVPALAEVCEGNAEATLWTCTLRSGVRFHDGAHFDANDVVMSYALQWDLDHALHIGRTGAFEYFAGFFAQFLNVPAE